MSSKKLPRNNRIHNQILPPKPPKVELSSILISDISAEAAAIRRSFRPSHVSFKDSVRDNSLDNNSSHTSINTKNERKAILSRYENEIAKNRKQKLEQKDQQAITRSFPSLNQRRTFYEPDYNNYQIPYVILCLQRYAKDNRLYNKQFLFEAHLLEIFQTNAYEAARFNRHLCITTLWPPLHNRCEVKYFLRKFFRHTQENQRRLRILLKETQN